MVHQKSMLLCVVLFTLCFIPTLAVNTTGVQSVEDLPIGLELEYKVSRINEHQRFEFLSWVSTPAGPAVETNFTRIKESTLTTEIILIDLPQWLQIHPNGTYLGGFDLPPIYTDTSNWEDGTETQIPPSPLIYEISVSFQTTPSGTYSTWFAHHYDFNFDSQYSRLDDRHYEMTTGVLLTYRYRYVAFTGFYENEESVDLTDHNLLELGIAPTEARSPFLLIIAVITVLILTCLFVIVWARYRSRNLAPAEHAPVISRDQDIPSEPPRKPITDTSDPTRPTCSVCNHPIDPLDEILACPHCHALAHSSHLLEYIKVKGTCPTCGHELDPIDFNLI